MYMHQTLPVCAEGLHFSAIHYQEEEVAGGIHWEEGLHSSEQEAVRGTPQLEVGRGTLQLEVVRGTPQLEVVRGTPQLEVVRGTPQLEVVRGTPQLEVVRGTPQLEVVRGRTLGAGRGKTPVAVRGRRQAERHMEPGLALEYRKHTGYEIVPALVHVKPHGGWGATWSGHRRQVSAIWWVSVTVSINRVPPLVDYNIATGAYGEVGEGIFLL